MTNALWGALVALALVTWLARKAGQDRASRTVVPMQSRQDVYGAGQFGHRTDDVADAYIRAADAEALLAMEQRRIMAAKWDQQQAAQRKLHARPVVTPDAETLEAWYARQPAPRKELGR